MSTKQNLLIKILVLSIAFFLFGFGRWLNLAVTLHWPTETAALTVVIKEREDRPPTTSDERDHHDNKRAK